MLDLKLHKLFAVVFCIFSIMFSFAQPVNLDFNSGNLNGWTFEEARNLDSYFMTNGTFGTSSKYSLMMPGVQEPNNVPVTIISPLGGKFMRIGSTSNGGFAYKLSQTFNVTAASSALSLCYAIVAKNVNNYCNERSYFNFVLRDNVGGIIPNTGHYITYGQSFSGSNCSGGDPSFSTSGNYKYKNWTIQNFSLQDYIGTNITIEFIASGTTDSTDTNPLYAYVDASLCSNNFSPNVLSVNTNTYNLLQTQNSILVCGTTTANIAAPSSAGSYSWTGPGITGSTSQNVTINQGGKYTLVFDNASACSNTTSVSFNISAGPTLSVNASNTICAGSALTMTATGGVYYTWLPAFYDTVGFNTNFVSQHVVYPIASSAYTVLGKDSSGCVNSSQHFVNVITVPSLAVAGNTAICLGGTTTLTASGADTYTWVPNVWVSGTFTGSPISLSPNYSTTYTVRGEDAVTGCKDSMDVGVFVDRNIADNYLSTGICVGDSILRTATGATSYTWSTGATTNTVMLKPSVTTIYTLSATSACGITQKVFTITVNPLPTIVANATQTLVCSGVPIKLFGSGGSTYLWSNSVVNNALFYPIATTYSVTGTNNNGCKNSAAISITITTTPTISVALSSTSLCAGQTITLTATGANSYTWNPLGLNSSTIIQTPTADIYYTLIGKSVAGCSSSTIISVPVYSTAPTFTFSNTTLTVCATNSYTLPIQQAPGFPYNYSYTQPGIPAAVNGIVISPFPASAMVFTVTAVNSCGSVSNTVQIIPQALPIVSITSPDSVCMGSSFSYSVSGADLYNINSGPPSTSNYTYSAGNTFTGMATNNPALQIYIIAGGKFLNGCLSDTVKYIKVLPSPTVTVSGGADVACSFCTTSLTASGASTYTWSTGAIGPVMAVSPSTTTNYTVTGQDTHGCIATLKTAVTVFDSLSVCFTPTLGIKAVSRVYNMADFNNDGSLDIAFTYFNLGYKLQIYFNSGNGIFLPQPAINVGYSVDNLKVADLNNDSYDDIILTTSQAGVGSNDFGIITYLNDGTGNFLGPNRFASLIGNGYVNLPITIGDVNGDGFTDVVTIGINKIITFKNNGVGLFTVTHQVNNYLSGNIFLKNLNGDNSADLVSIYADTTTVGINDGIGNYPTAQKYYTGLNNPVANICDVNSDGNSDIIMVGPSGISTLINNGNGVFAPIVSPVNTLWPTSVASADFNSDGFIDLVTTSVRSNTINLGSNYHLTNFVQVFMNNGNNTFHLPVNYPCSASGAFVLGPVFAKDINSDLKPDILSIIYTPNAQDSLAFLLNTIAPSLTITPQTNSVVCAGTSLSLTATGANTYTWSGGITNGSSFTPTQTQTYSVNGTASYGCIGSAVASVSISPDLSVTIPAPYLCTGNGASIYATGADTYSWSTGAFTSSITVSPTITTTYSVTGSDLTGCSYTKTVTLLVDSCADVWPGDSNSDGIADNLDILELGLHYTQTGLARASISNVWLGHAAPGWTGTITNGKNLHHSDCNGDGTINDNDTLAIYSNYGLSHAFRSPSQTLTIPELTIIPNQPMVVKGNWGSSSVYLGETATPVNNINGVAFTVNFDNTLIETNSVWIEYPTSFINASNQNLHFRKLGFSNNNLYTATTHTISNNVSGNGLIAILHYQIKSSLTTDEVLNLGIVQANQSNASGVITPLTSGTSTLMAIGASVGLNESSTSNLISVSPNPATSSVLITSSTDLEKVEIINLTGQVLISEIANSKTHCLNIESIANGVYFVKAYYNSKQVTLKKLIVQK